MGGRTDFAAQQAGLSLDRKISLANFSSRASLITRAESSSCLQGAQNGLESTEDCRSAVRHGNQQLCESHPQVICGQSFTSFYAGGRPATCPDKGLVETGVHLCGI